jgi:hypothetical protein
LLLAHDVQVGIIAALELVVYVAVRGVLPTPVGTAQEKKKKLA